MTSHTDRVISWFHTPQQTGRPRSLHLLASKGHTGHVSKPFNLNCQTRSTRGVSYSLATLEKASGRLMLSSREQTPVIMERHTRPGITVRLEGIVRRQRSLVVTTRSRSYFEQARFQQASCRQASRKGAGQRYSHTHHQPARKACSARPPSYKAVYLGSPALCRSLEPMSNSTNHFPSPLFFTQYT